ncbi:hypothetical protein MUK42_32577 [Musa troglodytarum]|uniref:Uncharacterized protein n=1 Tax=Musa troglodytarum TaxID=320322 RepID=A0A9E7FEU3_9LILI|nr:hypothetical protein MUK42_32577 [Musa troglodytarum]
MLLREELDTVAVCAPNAVFRVDLGYSIVELDPFILPTLPSRSQR